MKSKELQDEIAVEVEALEQVVYELQALRQELGLNEPTVREKTAAAAFLAQFYSGVENILKRISQFYRVPLPSGETWHVDLFKRFCDPAYFPLPFFFDEGLESDLASFRKFRHVFFHGYGFYLDWSRMQEGVAQIEDVFERFKLNLNDYLATLT